jgi:hypothetical protein
MCTAARLFLSRQAHELVCIIIGIVVLDWHVGDSFSLFVFFLKKEEDCYLFAPQRMNEVNCSIKHQAYERRMEQNFET